jgi:soluble lytic murein transglycosylase-like protein
MLVSATYRTAMEVKIDPLLVLAVMAIESGFNPFAESPVGAQGLMQVMSKVHHDKFQPLGGIKAALNPVANIKVGATILKEYVRRTGSVESGLKLYVGAGAFESDAGYGYKVLAEYKRLKDVASGKSVPTTTTVAVKAPAKPASQPDAEEKDDVLNQAQTPESPRHEKDRDEAGVVAAL